MTTPRPARPPAPFWENIPDAITSIHQWVLWSYIWMGRWTKAPFQPDGSCASSIDATTWCPFSFAETACATSSDRPYPFDGVGFVLTSDIVAHDFDHCLDRITYAILQPAIAEYVAALDSYTEVSPGGDGLRVLTAGQLPERDRHEHDIQMWDTRHFVSITGRRFPGTPATINARQSQIDAVHRMVFAQRNARRALQAEAASTTQSTVSDNDDDVIERARKASAKFAALFDGSWQGQGYKSQSEADVALCRFLAYWLGRDRGRIDRVFRTSGLMREKWEERGDYRKRTLEYAIG